MKSLARLSRIHEMTIENWDGSTYMPRGNSSFGNVSRTNWPMTETMAKI